MSHDSDLLDLARALEVAVVERVVTMGEAYDVYVDPEHKDGNYERRDVIAPHAVRACRSPLLRFYEVPAANGATVCDGSEYWAGLFTGPDFGCANHEAA